MIPRPKLHILDEITLPCAILRVVGDDAGTFAMVTFPIEALTAAGITLERMVEPRLSL